MPSPTNWRSRSCPVLLATTDSSTGWRRDAPTVLVVDNLEHVIDAAADLMALVDECPGLPVASCSHQPAHARSARRTHRAAARAAAPRRRPTGAASACGVRLMLERSHVADPTATDVEAASRIVSGVGGLPLAIELRGIHARSLGVATVYELLVADLALSGFEGADGPIRHRSLRECLLWTYDDLDKQARAVFRATGAFRGDVRSRIVECGRWQSSRGRGRTRHARRAPPRGSDRIGRWVLAESASIPQIREFPAGAAPVKIRSVAAIIDAHARRYAEVVVEIRTTFECGKAGAAFATFHREQPNVFAADKQFDNAPDGSEARPRKRVAWRSWSPSSAVKTRSVRGSEAWSKRGAGRHAAPVRGPGLGGVRRPDRQEPRHRGLGAGGHRGGDRPGTSGG